MLLLFLFEKSDRLNDEIHICHNILSIWIISFVKIENLIRWLNCSCSWIYTFFPMEHRSSSSSSSSVRVVSELRDRASLEWVCLGDKHVQWCCQCIYYARDLIRLGTMCACQSRQTVIIIIIIAMINTTDRLA
jgi:hypothetical protein